VESAGFSAGSVSPSIGGTGLGVDPSLLPHCWQKTQSVSLEASQTGQINLSDRSAEKTTVFASEEPGSLLGEELSELSGESVTAHIWQNLAPGRF